MKIGFSLGKCVRDIVNGKVAMDEVMVIVTRTNLSKTEHFEQLRYSYGYDRSYWGGLDLDECMRVSLELFSTGKLHQPRQYGARYDSPVSAEFVWMDLAPTSDHDNPMVAAAWAKYQMLVKLSSEDTRRVSAEEAAAAVAPTYVSDTSKLIDNLGPANINERLDARAQAKLERPAAPLNDDF